MSAHDRIPGDRFPPEPWRLVERALDAEAVGAAETLFSIGNGYLGLRGNAEEGRYGHEHATLINGFYETWQIRHAEHAYGFAEVGQTIVSAPDAKVIRLYVDDEPLNLEEADLLEYERSLDFRTGVLERRLLWLTPSGNRVRVESRRLVSFPERHLALMSFEVTLLDRAAPVTISSQLLNRQDGQDEYSQITGPGGVPDPRRAERLDEGRVLLPGEHWTSGSRSALSYRTARSGMRLAVMVDHAIATENPFTELHLSDEDTAKAVYHIAAEPGVPIQLLKTAAYHSSRGVPTRELIDRCARTLDRILVDGAPVQFERQQAWLDDFWRDADVVVPGDDRRQQAIRWNLFQLAQATARADGLGIAAKGVTGTGYSGHYFWDTEIYMLPFLTYTRPLWARNALRARQRMLPQARLRAAMMNEGGALFPWRTINGEEASAYYAAGTAQYHINADITYALARFVRATGDAGYIAGGAIDIAVETARMWITLGFWRANGDERFHIHGVTGPDEYTTVVNDNLFTNIMARFNLRYAAEAVRTLAEQDPAGFERMAARLRFEPEEAEEWERAAEAMAIPFSERLGIHPQDAQFLDREVWDLQHTPKERLPLLLHYHPLVIYRFQVLKQADVVLALFLHGDEFTDEQKRADFEYYDPLTTGDSTLSAVVQSIIAAEIGYQELALEYFEHSLYVDLADLHRNAADGVHVASTGGVWSALVSGFGGMRDHGGALSFDPRLPVGWPSLRFRLLWRGVRIEITITAERFAAEVVESEPGAAAEVRLSVRGLEHTVSTGAPLSVPLDGQGPVIAGAPALQPGRHRRDDGSMIVPTVPTATGSISLLSEPVVQSSAASESGARPAAVDGT